MLDTLEKGVNIKNLSLETPARAERTFDPKDWITEEDWQAITNQFNRGLEDQNIYKFLEQLAPIAVIDPERLATIPNVDKIVTNALADLPNFNPNVNWLEYLSRIKIISPNAIPPDELNRCRQLTRDSYSDSSAGFIGDLRKLANTFIVFPELRDKLGVPSNLKNEVIGQIRFWKQPQLKAYDGVAETIMLAKIVRPNMRNFEVDEQDKKGMEDYFHEVRKHKNWRMTLIQGMFLKGVYADRIEITEKGLQFVTNPPKFGVESALPQRRSF